MERASGPPERTASARTAAELRERREQTETRDRPPRTEEMGAVRRAPARERRPRLPTAAWVCFLVALLNGIAWGLITPLFQTSDEAGHVAYVQYVAETGKPPT